MKAMIMTDLYTLKKQLVQTGAAWAAVLLVISIVMFNSPIYILYVGPLEALMVMQGLMLDEEKGAWAGSRLALPLSRSQIITGRYASLAIVVVGAIALAAIIYLLVAILGFVFPTIGEIARFQMAFDASTMILCIGLAFALALITLGLTLPLIARFKSVNGMRYALAAVNFLFLIGIMVAMNPSTGLFASGTPALAGGPGSIVLLAAALVVMGGAFYVASATIAIRLYNKRDF